MKNLRLALPLLAVLTVLAVAAACSDSPTAAKRETGRGPAYNNGFGLGSGNREDTTATAVNRTVAGDGGLTLGSGDNVPADSSRGSEGDNGFGLGSGN